MALRSIWWKSMFLNWQLLTFDPEMQMLVGLEMIFFACMCISDLARLTLSALSNTDRFQFPFGPSCKASLPSTSLLSISSATPSAKYVFSYAYEVTFHLSLAAPRAPLSTSIPALSLSSTVTNSQHHCLGIKHINRTGRPISSISQGTKDVCYIAGKIQPGHEHG